MKKITTVIALLLVAAMIFAGCGKTEAPTVTGDLEQQLAALKAENEQLRSEIEKLTRQLESVQNAVLEDWTLSAAASADQSSATVTFTGKPNEVLEGQSMILVVTLNGLEAESVPCENKGKEYTASVELPAADGYGYYCLMISPNGTQQQVPLVTADTSPNDPLVNLGSGITAYCSLFVEDFTHEKDTLTIVSGFAQAQMPQISADGSDVTAAGAKLVLLYNGEEKESHDITLDDGEAEGIYESAISNISFTTPKLGEDDQMDLMLVVTLSSGGEISYNGCSWYISDGELVPVMG